MTPSSLGTTDMLPGGVSTESGIQSVLADPQAKGTLDTLDDLVRGMTDASEVGDQQVHSGPRARPACVRRDTGYHRNGLSI